MSDITTALSDLGFVSNYEVKDRKSITDLIPEDKRCGIYVLHCSNNEFYAGKAVNVTRRYLQHRKVHSDIEKVSFQQVKEKDLDKVEKFVIQDLERRQFKLRNHVYMSVILGETVFDEVINKEDQAKWVNNLYFQDMSGTRFNDENLRGRYHKKFEIFKSDSKAEGVIEVLREYVKTCVPFPVKTEIGFWSCSCLPTIKYGNASVFSRITLFQQEVLTACVIDGEVLFSFHVAKSPLEKVLSSHILFNNLKFPKTTFTRDVYNSGGFDQASLEVSGVKNGLKVLKNKDFLKAARLFNLRLMQKGRNLNFHYHCLDLADQLLGKPTL